MTRRYLVTQLPGQTRWAIHDRHLGGYCALPDEQGDLQPLEWDTRAGAEQWLYMSRVQWGRGLVTAPEGWERAA